jgi:hypothetical protein
VGRKSDGSPQERQTQQMPESAAPPAPAAVQNPVVRDRAATMYKNIKMALRVAGDDMTPEQMVFQAYPGGGHMLWFLGHLAWTLDAVVLQAFARQPSAIPADWPALFAAGTSAVPDASKYPSAAELKKKLEELARAARALLEQIPDEKLVENIPASHPASRLFPTYDIFLSAMGFHKAYHAGQMAFLRRMQGLPSLIAPPPNLVSARGVAGDEA